MSSRGELLRARTVALRSTSVVWRTWLACAYLIVVPSGSYFAYAAHDEQRVLQVIVLLLLSVSLWWQRDRVGSVLASLGRAVWGVVALLVLGSVSSLLALDPFTGWLDVGLLVGLLAAAVAVAVDVRRAPQLVAWLVCGSAAASLAYYAADLLTFPGVLADTAALWNRGAAGGFAHPRHLNQVQVVLLPAALALVVVRGHVAGWIRVVVFAVGTVTWWMVLVTTGRGAAAALVVAALLLAVFRGPTGRRVGAAITASGLLASAGAWITHWRSTGVSEAITSAGRSSVVTVNGRDVLWRDALETGWSRPLFGIGPGHIAHAEVAGPDIADQFANHPHNLVLQFVAEWGFPAAALVLVAVVVVCLRLTLLAWPEPGGGVDRVLVDGVAGGVLGWLALGLVSGVLVMPVSATAFTVMAGVLLGLHSMAADPVGRWPSQVVVGVLLAALLGIAGPVLEVSTSTPTARATDQRAFLGGSGSDLLVPRFWVQGFRAVPWEPPPAPVPVGMPSLLTPSEHEVTM